MIHDALGILRHRLVSLGRPMTNKLAQVQATEAQLNYEDLWPYAGTESQHDLLSVPSPYVAQLRTTPPPSHPLEGMEKGQHPPRTPALTRAGTPHTLRQDRGYSYPLDPDKHHPCATLRKQESTARR
jgi:hypothetical protein